MLGRQTHENYQNLRTVSEKNKKQTNIVRLFISTSEAQETKHGSRTSVNMRLTIRPVLEALKEGFFFLVSIHSRSEQTSSQLMQLQTIFRNKLACPILVT